MWRNFFVMLASKNMHVDLFASTDYVRPLLGSKPEAIGWVRQSADIVEVSKALMAIFHSSIISNKYFIN